MPLDLGPDNRVMHQHHSEVPEIEGRGQATKDEQPHAVLSPDPGEHSKRDSIEEA